MYPYNHFKCDNTFAFWCPKLSFSSFVSNSLIVEGCRSFMVLCSLKLHHVHLILRLIIIHSKYFPWMDFCSLKCVAVFYLFIYLFVILFSKFFFILLDYETDDEAKGLLDDSEENGKNNWTTTTITLRDVLWTPSVKTRASVFISVGFLKSVFNVSCSMCTCHCPRSPLIFVTSSVNAFCLLLLIDCSDCLFRRT